ncbi:MAG: restriction endonuclease subunit S [Chitinophagaceae bacterium]
MQSILQPYKIYKRIQYDYVTQVPDDWQLLPNIAIFEERIERGHINEELLSVTIGKGVIKQTEVEIKKDSSNEDKSKYKLIRVGDVAYNKMRMWQGALGYSSYQGISSPAYVILKPKMKMNPRYFHYMFRTSFYTNYSKRYSYGIVDDQLSLRYTDFKRMYSIVPPLETQNDIVKYLDKKNNEIEKLINNKEKLINLLEEEKIANITFAISGGICLDDDVQHTEDSWLPLIPSKWNWYRIKTVCTKITNGFVGATRDILVPHGVKYIQSLHIRNNSIDFHTPYFVKEKWSKQNNRSILKEGDILITQTGGKTGNLCVVPKEFEGANCHALIILKANKKKIIPEYLFFVLKSYYGESKLYSIRTGALHPHLNSTIVCDVNIPVPPLETQQEIVSKIKEANKILNSAISKAQKEISSIKEYQKSLITDLITGKRSVPKLQLV